VWATRGFFWFGLPTSSLEPLDGFGLQRDGRSHVSANLGSTSAPQRSKVSRHTSEDTVPI